MRVRAKHLGYFDTVGDGKAREILPGQEFDIPDKMRLPRWVEKVEAKPAVPAELKPSGKPPAGGGPSVI
jgi:hypothetical protein